MGWIHEGLGGAGAASCPRCGKHDASERCPEREAEYQRELEEYRAEQAARKVAFEEAPLAPTDDARKVWVGGFDGEKAVATRFDVLVAEAARNGERPYRLFDGRYRKEADHYGYVPGEAEKKK